MVEDKKMKPEIIRILIINREEQSSLVAQCLEYDICVNGKDVREIIGRFEIAFTLRIIQNGGLKGYRQAPKYYFDLWDKLENKKKNPKKIKIRDEEALYYKTAA